MKKLIMMIVAASVATVAQAELITFDFEGATGADLDGLTSGSSIVSGTGFDVTLSAMANDGELNQTASGFGINASGSGDDTDGFDDASGVTEFMSFSFSIPMGYQATFVSAEFDRLTSSAEMGSIVFDGGGTVDFDDSFTSNVVPVNEAITSGQNITLNHVAGNGFGLENIVLDVTVIPEPSSMALGIFGLLFARLFRRK